MSDESAFGNVRNGVSNVVRFIDLWLALGLANVGLVAVLNATLINESFGSTLLVSTLVTVSAAGFIYSRYPEIRAGTVWKFGAVVFLSFAVLATLNESLNAPANGSLYDILTALLSWIAALAIGCVVAWPDE